MDPITEITFDPVYNLIRRHFPLLKSHAKLLANELYEECSRQCLKKLRSTGTWVDEHSQEYHISMDHKLLSIMKNLDPESVIYESCEDDPNRPEPLSLLHRVVNGYLISVLAPNDEEELTKSEKSEKSELTKSTAPEPASDVDEVRRVGSTNSNSTRVMKPWLLAASISLTTDDSDTLFAAINGLSLTDLCSLTPSKLNPYFTQEVRDKIQLRSEQKIVTKYTKMYKCSECGENKGDVHRSQTRSSDEDSTISVTCLGCGNKWFIGSG